MRPTVRPVGGQPWRSLRTRYPPSWTMKPAAGTERHRLSATYLMHAADGQRTNEVRPVIDDLWYKNGVIYCLSVGTYMDANGDGIGDFSGLLRRLDYLHGLGITAIWLMPFPTSPHRDDGYDISDYYGINPAYGTLGDFVEFTHGARR